MNTEKWVTVAQLQKLIQIDFTKQLSKKNKMSFSQSSQSRKLNVKYQ